MSRVNFIVCFIQPLVRIRFRLPRQNWSLSRPSPMPIPAILSPDILIQPVLVMRTVIPSQSKKKRYSAALFSHFYLFFFLYPARYISKLPWHKLSNNPPFFKIIYCWFFKRISFIILAGNGFSGLNFFLYPPDFLKIK